MSSNPQIRNLGEIKVINLIKDLILKKTGNELISDDSFFFNLEDIKQSESLVLNSDMLVSRTDVPPQMNPYQIGRKSVIMNLSDLLVKGVIPRGIIISFGLPRDLRKDKFIDLMFGIIDSTLNFNLKYIGGDINETEDLIINPTVFGFKVPSNIIYRKGIMPNDILAINKKFGLTGVGFDILLNRKEDLLNSRKYKRSIQSVLEPHIEGIEALILSERKLATSSIDSSDGLAKSLRDLMLSNQNSGFEINFDDNLIDTEAVMYSEEFNINLEDLIFNGGEEYIHLFTIRPQDFSDAKKLIQDKGGDLFEIGKVISEESIYILKENRKSELKSNGFEHFNK
ncbi:MAG: thiamine-monophosphate kinase [Candidatus Thorarchaeota archaeon]